MHPRAGDPDSICETCAAYDAANSECRRGSPGFVQTQEDNGDTYALAVWPRVTPIDWCFDWLPGDTMGQAPIVEPEKPAPIDPFHVPQATPTIGPATTAEKPRPQYGTVTMKQSDIEQSTSGAPATTEESTKP